MILYVILAFLLTFNVTLILSKINIFALFGRFSTSFGQLPTVQLIQHPLTFLFLKGNIIFRKLFLYLICIYLTPQTHCFPLDLPFYRKTAQTKFIVNVKCFEVLY